MSEISSKKQRLPKYCAAWLPADTPKVLQHPLCRQILRVLHRDVEKLSVSELAASGFLPCSATTTRRHMHALHEARLVRRAGSELVRNSMKHYFSASVANKSLVLGVLRDMEQADKQFLARATAR